MSEDKTTTPAEEAALNAVDLSTIVSAPDDSFMSAADLLKEEDAAKPPKKSKKKLVKVEQEEDDTEEEEERPLMSSPEWSDFVLRQFEDNELDPNGRPLVHGLRRVTRLLLGPILQSNADPFQAPNYVPGYEKLLWQPAVVSYTVEILMLHLEHEIQEPYKVMFRDVADVTAANTDPDIARHASAAAATKAEARCLRKALQLRTAASEEMTRVPVEEASMDGMITPSQVNFINILCQRNDISVMKYINATTVKTVDGKRVVIAKKYVKIEDVPFGAAVKMIEYLSGLQNKQQFDPVFKGYQADWM